MIGTTPLAVSGVGTQTPDTIAYRRWQHEEPHVTFARLHASRDGDETRRITTLVCVGSIVGVVLAFVAVSLSGALPARARGDFTASPESITTTVDEVMLGVPAVVHAQEASGSAAERQVDDATPAAPKLVHLGTVRVTTYQANVHETDSDPSHTASGAKVADGQIAVSRDLLWRNGGPLRWGDTVKLTDPDGPARCNRTYEVQDTMAARFRMRVDIYLPARESYFSCYSATLEKVVSG